MKINLTKGLSVPCTLYMAISERTVLIYVNQYTKYIQGVPIKSAATLKQHFSITKRLAENVKTVLELRGIGL